MPTENRSSNTENAPCPFCGGQVDPEGWLRGDGVRGPECESCGATAPTLGVWSGAQPAEQHQGEPVAEFGADYIFNLRKQPNGERWPVGTKLYTNADPGEVERWKNLHSAIQLRRDHHRDKAESLRAQLAERDALLRHLYDHNELSLGDDQLILAALSASAEPQVTKDLLHRGPPAVATQSLTHCGEPSTSMPASKDSSAVVERDREIPGTSFQRLNHLANQGE